MENWPFHDETSGFKIHEQLFYGIGDSGSMAVWDKETREEVFTELKKKWGFLDSDFGTKPEDLGSYVVTVLSGREFVDRLKVVGNLSDFGHWDGE